jgi:hypothetical protein
MKDLGMPHNHYATGNGKFALHRKRLYQNAGHWKNNTHSYDEIAFPVTHVLKEREKNVWKGKQIYERVTGV